MAPVKEMPSIRVKVRPGFVVFQRIGNQPHRAGAIVTLTLTEYNTQKWKCERLDGLDKTGKKSAEELRKEADALVKAADDLEAEGGEDEDEDEDEDGDEDDDDDDNEDEDDDEDEEEGDEDEDEEEGDDVKEKDAGELVKNKAVEEAPVKKAPAKKAATRKPVAKKK